MAATTTRSRLLPSLATVPDDTPVPRRRTSRRAAGRGFGGWCATIAWGAGAALICSGLAVAGFATGGLAAWLETAPPIEPIENYDPPETTVILDDAGTPFASLFAERRQVVPLSELPPLLPDAFLAIEDTDFRQHLGVNPKGVLRAAIANARKGTAAQGASTITQQLPRNLLPHIGREKTIRRKVIEALLALQIERRYSKDQILEIYLNQIYLGSGSYGVEAAAQTYFGKSARDLQLPEIALLAGLPQLPERYSPLNDLDRARTRRDQVLERLLNLGWITGPEYDSVITSPVEPTPGGTGSRSWAEYGHFVDAARAELGRADLLEGRALHEEGWRVSTTLDARAQRAAMKVLAESLEAEEDQWLSARPARFAEAVEDGSWWDAPRAGQVRMARVVRRFENSLVVELADEWRADLAIPAASARFFTQEAGVVAGSGVDIEVTSVESGGRRLFRGRLLPDKRLQGAIACVDAHTGAVRALAGGRRWDDQANGGFFNRATRARRQAGSTMKPMFYATALESGYTPYSIFEDSPISFSGGYRPRNYDGEFHGALGLQRALELSNNIVTIRMTMAVGIEHATDSVARFQSEQSVRRWDLPREVSVPLGTTTVTPLELATAYTTFANGGVLREPWIVREVRDGSGNVLWRNTPVEREILHPRSAAWITQMMVGVMTHGTGRAVRESLPESLREHVAGKTGTTNENRDAWFAGFTPQHVVTVWVGFDTPLPLGEGRTGGKVAGPIWAKFVSELEGNDAQPAEPLPLPEGWNWELVDLGTSEPVEGTAADAGHAWRVLKTSTDYVTAFVP